MRKLKKQDRTSSRLPTDTERKYKLGQIELTAEELDKLKSELVVDEYLSTTSSNAVQNKTITEALNNKVTKEKGKGLSTNDFTEEHLKNSHTHANKSVLDSITQKNIDSWNGNGSTLGIYSTTEQVVGKWINGEILYRKVLQTTISGVVGGYYASVETQISGMTTAVKIDWFVQTGNGNFYNPPNLIIRQKGENIAHSRSDETYGTGIPLTIIVEYIK